MASRRTLVQAAALLAATSAVACAPACGDELRTGAAAYGDWHSDAPGVRRKITAADLPAPLASPSTGYPPQVTRRPADAALRVPPGFSVAPFATGLESPRVVRVAPNGDIFVAETEAGRVHVLRAATGAASASESEVFASGLGSPYGIGFYPPGSDPRFIYITTETEILRFPYRNGDLHAVNEPEVLASLPAGGHSTRDLVFAPDGTAMYVAVGSGSNFGEDTAPLADAEALSFERSHVLGAAWGREVDRADVLAFDPQGKNKRVFATGIRNCAGLTIEPENGKLWCAVNERDELGDDLPPDYATSVTEGAFYGWPWYYTGGHPDPRRNGARPDLAAEVTVPDVLFQPHSAPLGIAFYESSQFPAQYKGSAFVALHGSWNRAKRTGYKVVRLPMKDGKPSGEYEDFLVGFVADEANVWGRPVDVAVAPDGALLVSDNVGGIIWRVSYKAP